MMEYRRLQQAFDLDVMKWRMEQLHAREKRCSHSDFAAGAEYCTTALADAGFEQIELLEHQADGLTTFLDSTMPPAWDLCGRSVLQIAGEDTILADTDVTPFAAAPWSAPTPPGGIEGELISVFPGELPDVCGKWALILIPDGRNPRGEYIEQLYSRGAVGAVAVNCQSGERYPDSVTWFNGTGKFGWYPVAGDQRLPLFSISSHCYEMLRRRLAAGSVRVHGEMKSRIYKGKIFTITAVIPGRTQQEYALFSHIYEPFLGDNAFGFGAVCGIGQAIRSICSYPQKTLRVFFSMEFYGFSAFLADTGRASKITGGLNMDALNHRFSRQLTFCLSPLCRPWFGDWLLLDELKEALPETRIVKAAGNLSDDTFMGDPMFGGIPVNWIYNPSGITHHCGCADFEPDWKRAEQELPALASAVLAMLQCSPESCRRFEAAAEQDFRMQSAGILERTWSAREKELLLKASRDYQIGRLQSAANYCGAVFSGDGLAKLYSRACAEISGKDFLSDSEKRADQMIPVRLKPTPFSLADIPYKSRKIFRAPRLLFSLLDGKHTLWEAIRLADWALEQRSADQQIDLLIELLEYLSRYRYITFNHKIQEEALSR